MRTAPSRNRPMMDPNNSATWPTPVNERLMDEDLEDLAEILDRLSRLVSISVNPGHGFFSEKLSSLRCRCYGELYRRKANKGPKKT